MGVGHHQTVRFSRVSRVSRARIRVNVRTRVRFSFSADPFKVTGRVKVSYHVQLISALIKPQSFRRDARPMRPSA